MQATTSFLLLLIIQQVLFAFALFPTTTFAAKPQNPFLQMASSATSSSSSSTTAAATKTAQESSSKIPNWRVIRDPSTEATALQDADTILQQRELWSEDAYQDSLQLYHKLVSCQDSYVSQPILTALNCIDHAYRLYGPESVICSYNGGKDAVVIFHLLRAAMAHFYDTAPARRYRPRAIYFENKHEFEQVTAFVNDTVKEYDVDMVAFSEGIGFCKGLEILVQKNRPVGDSSITFPMAFVLGTRTTDPNAGSQGHFAPSSHYMPPFMRVNPVLHWTYGHVWHFLRLYQLPYCSLYDQGYTSLGTVKDTLPCPALAVPGGSNTSVPKYWPAYMLRDWDQERAGRISKPKKTTTTTLSAAKTTTTTTTTDTIPQMIAVQSNASLSRLSAMSDAQALQRKVGDNDGAEELVYYNNNNTELLQQQSQDYASVVSYSTNTITQKSVGLLIIGDEILKGLTADTNTQVAAKALREHNVLLRRVVVVPDDQDDIVDEIGRLQQEVDVIITSGGVGPTHDDVTIKSVAVALGREMVFHEEMAQLLQKKMSTQDLTEAQKKMATLPARSKLRYLTEDSNEWPVLQCKNIFILPGVPQFFSAKINNVAAYLSCQLERCQAYKVVLSVDENSIVSILNQVVKNHPNVTIGSYPFVSNSDYKTIITVEGCMMLYSAGTSGTASRSNSMILDKSAIDATKTDMNAMVRLALDELIHALPPGSVLRVDNEDLGLFN